jgi:hypothetical protein
MVVIHRHNEALLPRLLGLKDHSPFILVLDSLAQSADYLVQEALHRVPLVSNDLANGGELLAHSRKQMQYCFRLRPKIRQRKLAA